MIVCFDSFALFRYEVPLNNHGADYVSINKATTSTKPGRQKIFRAVRLRTTRLDLFVGLLFENVDHSVREGTVVRYCLEPLSPKLGEQNVRWMGCSFVLGSDAQAEKGG